MYGVRIGEIEKVIHPPWDLRKYQCLISPFHDLREENKQRTLVMYNIADKMITGCKFDFAIFAIFAILTLQIPIAGADLGFIKGGGGG